MTSPKPPTPDPAATPSVAVPPTVPAAAIASYVDHALVVQGWDLPSEARERVALQFERLAEIVSTLRAVALDPMHDEPAPVFTPRAVAGGGSR